MSESETLQARGDTHPRQDARLTALLRDLQPVTMRPGERLSTLVDGYVEDRIPAFPMLGRFIASHEDAAAAFAALRSPYVERLAWMVTNGQGMVIASQIHSIGSLTEASLPQNPSDFQPMLDAARRAGPGATVWMSHNHPSGDPAPSRADMDGYHRVGTYLWMQGGVPFRGLITNGNRFVEVDWRMNEWARFSYRYALRSRPYEQMPFDDRRLAITDHQEAAAALRLVQTTAPSTVGFYTDVHQRVAGVCVYPGAPPAPRVLDADAARLGAVGVMLGTTGDLAGANMAWQSYREAAMGSRIVVAVNDLLVDDGAMVHGLRTGMSWPAEPHGVSEEPRPALEREVGAEALALSVAAAGAAPSAMEAQDAAKLDLGAVRPDLGAQGVAVAAMPIGAPGAPDAFAVVRQGADGPWAIAVVRGAQVEADAETWRNTFDSAGEAVACARAIARDMAMGVPEPARAASAAAWRTTLAPPPAPAAMAVAPATPSPRHGLPERMERTGYVDDLGDELVVMPGRADWGADGWFVAQLITERQFVTPILFFDQRQAAVDAVPEVASDRGYAKPAAAGAAEASSSTDEASASRRGRRGPRGPRGQHQDFGAKIGGARKDEWATRGLTVADMANWTDAERQAYANRDAVWPKPDWAAAIADGMPPAIAFMGNQVRSAIPDPSPQVMGTMQPEQRTSMLNRYVELVSQIRERVMLARTRQGLQELADPINSLSYLMSMDRRAYRSLSKCTSFGEWKEQQAQAEVDRTGWPNQDSAWRRFYDFHCTKAGSTVYNNGQRVTLANDEWFVTKHKQHYILLAELPSREAAEEAAKQHYLASRAHHVERLVRPYRSDAPRVGPDYRKGRDVTGDDILREFGFRGGEFGLWTNQADRQQHLNQCFDALHDLARVLGVPPKAISLNGELGIAFGARGQGKAAAHYEPARVVINLTKTHGAGALAHEWGHGVDDYMGRLAWRGAAAKYLSDPDNIGHIIRPDHTQAERERWLQIQAKWGAIHEAIRKRLPTIEETTGELEKDVERWRVATSSWIKSGLNSVERADAAAGDPGRHAKQLAEMTAIGSALCGERPLPAGKSIPELAEAFMDLRDHATGGTMKRSEVNKAVKAISNNAHGLALQRDVLARWHRDGHSDVWRQRRQKPSVYLTTSEAKSSDYWSRPTELWARAFEGWVQDQLAAKGESNSYLVTGAGGLAKDTPEPVKAWASLYPSGDERVRINAAISSWAQDLRVTEDQGKVRLHEDRVAYNPTTLPVPVTGDMRLRGAFAAQTYCSPRQGDLTPEQAEVRRIAYALRTGDPRAVVVAARDMAPLVPGHVALVPVPDSNGDTSANRALAQAIAAITGNRVADVLRRPAPVESSRMLRLAGGQGLAPQDHRFTATSQPGDVMLIDNVVTSGATAVAAARAFLVPPLALGYADASGTVRHHYVNVGRQADAVRYQVAAAWRMAQGAAWERDPDFGQPNARELRQQMDLVGLVAVPGGLVGSRHGGVRLSIAEAVGDIPVRRSIYGQAVGLAASADQAQGR